MIPKTLWRNTVTVCLLWGGHQPVQMEDGFFLAPEVTLPISKGRQFSHTSNDSQACSPGRSQAVQ